MRSLFDIARERRAQATVEMAVVVPVLIVLALIVYNLMQFACAVARFDRAAPDVVIARAVSPAGTSGLEVTAQVQDALQRLMEPYGVRVTVVNEADEATGAELLSLAVAPQTYRCAMTYTPWPSGFSIAGVSMGAPALLKHERAVVIDPWRPGVVM